MPRPSLSHLYFETLSLSKTPLKWLACAAFIHAGLICIPTGTYKPRDYGIVFRDGNGGVEVQLILESAESSPEQSTTPPDASPDLDDSTAQSPEPDPVVVDAEQSDSAPTKPSTTTALHPTRQKTIRTADRVTTPSRAGTAIAQPAAKVYTTQPPYPPRARELGVEGVVRLQVRIGTDGSPREIKIVRPSGRSDFDLASVNTVQREWRFRPARTADGTPVESTVVVAIRFTLKS
jgi:periplasmic protein TonB